MRQLSHCVIQSCFTNRRTTICNNLIVYARRFVLTDPSALSKERAMLRVLVCEQPRPKASVVIVHEHRLRAVNFKCRLPPNTMANHICRSRAYALLGLDQT